MPTWQSTQSHSQCSTQSIVCHGGTHQPLNTMSWKHSHVSCRPAKCFWLQWQEQGGFRVTLGFTKWNVCHIHETQCGEMDAIHFSLPFDDLRASCLPESIVCRFLVGWSLHCCSCICTINAKMVFSVFPHYHHLFVAIRFDGLSYLLTECYSYVVTLFYLWFETPQINIQLCSSFLGILKRFS